MNTSDSVHFQKKAFFISLLIAALIGCFLVFCRILVPTAKAAVFSQNPPDSMLISLSDLSGYQETAPAPGIAKSALQPANSAPAAVPVSGKEQLSLTDNGLFTNYKGSPGKTQLQPAGPAEEQKISSIPTTGLVPGEAATTDDKGAQVNLKGRKVLLLPKITDARESGIVVVNIVVNREGSVIKAETNGRGTNTASVELKVLAGKAAFQTRFSASETEELQKGTITYVFEF